MLTNLMGEKKANKKAILKALETAQARGLTATFDFSNNHESYSVSGITADLSSILAEARIRLAGAEAEKGPVTNQKNLSDEDWETAMEQTADRPALSLTDVDRTTIEDWDANADVSLSLSNLLKLPEGEELASGVSHVADLTAEFDTEAIAEATAALSAAIDAENAAAAVAAENGIEASTNADASAAPDAGGAAQIDELKSNIKAMDRELGLLETKRDILRQQLEMSEQKADILREQLLQWQAESDYVRKQFDEARMHNRLLSEEVEKLKLDNESITNTVSLAWQQGYLAGRAAAEEEEKQRHVVESLTTAAHSTKGGATSDAGSANQQTIFVVADSSSLVIDDPEVLNDPFTAKLLNALSSDGGEVGSLYEEPLTAPVYDQVETESHVAYSQEPHGYAAPPLPTSIHSDLEAEALTGSGQFDSTPDGYEKSAHAEEVSEVAESAPLPPPLPTPQPAPKTAHVESTQAEAAQSAPPATDKDLHPWSDKDGLEQSQNFTADELHSLFRHRVEEKETKNTGPVNTAAASPTQNTGSTKKFVGSKHAASGATTQGGMNAAAARAYPPEIRKACRLLGLNPEDVTTRQVVTEAWKKEMSKPGVHPDTGGDTEMAIYLNTAKDALMRWVDDQTPKLGKKFGPSSGRETPKPNKQD